MSLQFFNAVLGGIVIGLAMAISVGPTLFAIIKYSLTFSYKAGIAFILGVCVSDVLYVSIANLALTWLEFIGQFKFYIAIIGSALLLLAGLVSLLRKRKAVLLNDDNKILVTNGKLLQISFSGFLMNTLNPGVILSWLAAVTAVATKSAGYRFILFATCLGLVLSIDFLKVFLAEKIRSKLTLNTIQILQKVSAGIILAIGLIIFIRAIYTKGDLF